MSQNQRGGRSSGNTTILSNGGAAVAGGISTALDGYPLSRIRHNVTDARLEEYRLDAINAIQLETAVPTSAVAATNLSTTSAAAALTAATNDLTVTIPRLLEAASSEAREARRAMRAIVNSHLASQKRALYMLESGKGRVEHLRENFHKMGNVMSKMKASSSYKELVRAQIYHTNVTRVINWTNALRDVEKYSVLVKEPDAEVAEEDEEEEFEEEEYEEEEDEEEEYEEDEEYEEEEEEETSAKPKAPKSKPTKPAVGHPPKAHKKPAENEAEKTVNLKELHAHCRKMETVWLELQDAQDEHYSVFAPYLEDQKLITERFVVIAKKVLAQTIQIALARNKAGSRAPATVGAPTEFQRLSACVDICHIEKGNPIIRSEDARRNNFIESREQLKKSFDTLSDFGIDSVAVCISKSVDVFWDEVIISQLDNYQFNLAKHPEALKELEKSLDALHNVLLPMNYKYPIFHLVVRAIHAEVVRALQQFGDPVNKIDSSFLLDCIAICHWYKNMLLDGDNNYAQYLVAGNGITVTTPTSSGSGKSFTDKRMGTDFPHDVDESVLNITSAAVIGLKEDLSKQAISTARDVVFRGAPKPPDGSNEPLLTDGPNDLLTAVGRTVDGLDTNVIPDKDMALDVKRRLGEACVTALHSYVEVCRDSCVYRRWVVSHQKPPEDPKLKKKQEKTKKKGKTDAQPAEGEEAEKAKEEVDENEWKHDWATTLIAFANDLYDIDGRVESVEEGFASAWPTSLSVEQCKDKDVSELQADPNTSPFVALRVMLTDVYPLEYVDRFVGTYLLHNDLLEPMWQNLFTNKDLNHNWFNQDSSPLLAVRDTFVDFVQNLYKPIMNPHLLVLVLKALPAAMVSRYIDRFIASVAYYSKDKWVGNASNTNSKKDIPLFADCMMRDVDLLEETFSLPELLGLSGTEEEHRGEEHQPRSSRGSKSTSKKGKKSATAAAAATAAAVSAAVKDPSNPNSAALRLVSAIRALHTFLVLDPALTVEALVDTIQREVLVPFGDIPSYLPLAILKKRDEKYKILKKAWAQASAIQRRGPDDLPTMALTITSTKERQGPVMVTVTSVTAVATPPAPTIFAQFHKYNKTGPLSLDQLEKETAKRDKEEDKKMAELIANEARQLKEEAAAREAKGGRSRHVQMEDEGEVVMEDLSALLG